MTPSTDVVVVVALLVHAGLGLAGYALWVRFVRGRTCPLPDDEGAPAGLAHFLFGFAAMLVVQGGVLQLLTDGAALEEEGVDPTLGQMLLAQVGGAVAVVVTLLVMGARGPGGLRSLGLRPHRGSSAPVTALAAWLLALPAMFLAWMINASLLPADEVLQQSLSLFQGDGESMRSPLVWLAIVVVLPAAEELLMRGALYGGLRHHVPTGLAVLASALVFGVLHDGAARLPVAVLGVVLALLYERTGSLVVPYLVHVLHNGLTLVLMTATASGGSP